MTIDGIDIADYGLTLLNSTGELDFPEIKRPLQHNWEDEHGLDIDLTTALQQPRTIILEFLFQQSTALEYQLNLEAFQDLLQAPGLRIVKYDYLDKPLFLALSTEVPVDRLNGFGSSQISAKLVFEMLEPNPVGRYFLVEDSVVYEVSFIITCTTPITVNWGDGQVEVVYGASQSVSYIYDSAIVGVYVALFGDMDGITNITDIVGLTEIV